MAEVKYAGYVKTSDFGPVGLIYRVTISDELVKRMTDILMRIKDMDLCAVKFNWGGVEVFNQWPGKMKDTIWVDPDDDMETLEDTYGSPDCSPEELEEYPSCLLVNLYSDGYFYWSWYPKHGSQAERCETISFSFDEVKKALKQKKRKKE